MIRDAHRADLAGLALLDRLCFGSGAWTEAQLLGEQDRAGGVFLVAAQPGLRGLALGWSLAGEAEVLRLAVAPEYRREGLGHLLLTRLEARLIQGGAQRIFLEVRSDNQAAIRLYQQHGYASIGTRPRYYTDGCDALILARAT